MSDDVVKEELRSAIAAGQFFTGLPGVVAVCVALVAIAVVTSRG
jgi:hypothetical protein